MDERCTEKTDEELVALSLEDQEYFGCLMRRYTAPLGRYIIRVVPSFRNSIDDVLQEVFIKIYLNLRGFDPSLKFSSWAYRITHNHAVSLLRKEKTRPQLVSTDNDTYDFFERYVADGQPNENEIRYAKEEVSRVLAEIDQKYREVLILRYLEEMDYEEISDILKKPVGTIGTLLSRAKAIFKDEYVKKYGTEK
ncbi:MAG: RNA polymerase sigma factor [Candidatus Paceibacterota bacterium]|jgi:RNA polymerase sigma-70 factor (ECF subfamily)|nr:RNA polymerase sigma factor [Candidatus Paceibacterota bacterium]